MFEGLTQHCSAKYKNPFTLNRSLGSPRLRQAQPERVLHLSEQY
jgi:hypothetical protein